MSIGNITLQDIADRCGVTKVTVSRALRGHRHEVSEATIKRIREVADELGYDASSQHVARRLAMRKVGKESLNHLIALFFPAALVAEPYYRPFLTGVMESLNREHFGLLMNYSNTDAAAEDILPLFGRGDVDGAIVLASTSIFQPVLEKLRKLRGFGDHPVVSMIDPMPGTGSVIADDTGGMFAATNHLLDLGHRKFLHFFTVTEENITSTRRIAGIVKALKARNLDPATHLVRCPMAVENRERAHGNLFQALEAHPDTTAIFAMNDLNAVMINRFLKDAGISIPERYSLVGFDDVFEIFNGQHENILTTVRVPLRDIGRVAADMVIKAAREDEQSVWQEMLPTELVVRQSTGPVRSA